jgi:hypothetical protein
VNGAISALGGAGRHHHQQATHGATVIGVTSFEVMEGADQNLVMGGRSVLEIKLTAGGDVGAAVIV